MPLLGDLKARFTTALNAVPAGQWKILITDQHSQALLDQVYTNFEILQQNVTSVEPLHSPRRPMSVHAIYLLTPTSQNVDRLIADFAGGRRTYNSAYLFFIDGINDRLADRLTSSMPPDVLKAFTELYCNFWALEERIFSLKTPSSFFTMYGTPGGAASAELAVQAFEDDVKVVGRTILNILATMNENPYIRYYQPAHHAPLGPLANQSPASSSATLAAPQPQTAATQGHPNSLRWRSAMSGAISAAGGSGGSSRSQAAASAEHLSRKLAFQVQADLDEYMAANPEFPAATGRPKSVLFIVDRSMDPVAPFLHEFWYQAMVNDLLPIKDGVRYKYKYTNTVGAKEDREAILSEDDKVWCSVRHLHMKDAIDTLNTNFAQFSAEHAGFAGGADQVNVNDLKDMMASLPQFQKDRDLYSLHLDMAAECMSFFDKKHLNLVANVEQCCATGFTSEGKTPKTLVEEMVPLLDDRALTQFDKVRIIALYILFKDGVADEDRRRLYQHARLAITEQDAVNNLVMLGAKVIKDSRDRSSKTRIKQKYQNAEGEYELSRYRPVVQTVLEDHHSNRLDQSLFPFVRDVPPEMTTQSSLRAGGSSSPAPLASSSLRSARPTWHKGPSARSTNTEGRQRMILFVAGGMTYSEMRLAYTIGQSLGKDVYIGSTHVITPENFVKDLRSIARGGIGANPPHSIPVHPQSPGTPARSPGRPADYQMILDRRHWQPPVGPPALPPPSQASNGGGAPGRPGMPGPAGSFGSQAGVNQMMGDLSLGGKEGKGSLKGKGDGEKKKGLFGKMKW